MNFSPSLHEKLDESTFWANALLAPTLYRVHQTSIHCAHKTLIYRVHKTLIYRVHKSLIYRVQKNLMHRVHTICMEILSANIFIGPK